MFKKRTQEEKDAFQQKLEEEQLRRAKVNLSAGDGWLEVVKDFEKDFLKYVEENPNFTHYFERFLQSLGVIKIIDIKLSQFTIKQPEVFLLYQTKWDALQELRVRRKYAKEQNNLPISEYNY